MKNIDVKVDGDMLTLKIDLSQTHGPSGSGKSTIIATTSGNQPIATVGGNPVILGLNVYTK